jgi:hypothetical protein
VTLTELDPTELFTEQRRAQTMRWLFQLIRSHRLPTPKGIHLGEIVYAGETQRYVQVDLAEDIDVTGWADAIGADQVRVQDVNDGVHEWTSHRVSVFQQPGRRTDWHSLTVSSFHHYRPVTSPAVTA